MVADNTTMVDVLAIVASDHILLLYSVVHYVYIHWDWFVSTNLAKASSSYWFHGIALAEILVMIVQNTSW